MADQDDDITRMLMSFLKDKHIALGQTSTSLLDINRILKGLRTLKAGLDTADPANIDFHKTSKALTKSLITLAKLTHQNTICLLMYMSVGDFDMDATKLLTKMGKGKEAMQAVWDQTARGDRE